MAHSLKSFPSLLKFTFLDRLPLTAPCHSLFPYPVLLSILYNYRFLTDIFVSLLWKRERTDTGGETSILTTDVIQRKTEVLLSEGHGEHTDQHSPLKAPTMSKVLWVCSFM